MFLGLLGLVVAVLVCPDMLTRIMLQLVAASVLFAAPAAFDVLAQRLSTYQSNPTCRFATGVLLGIAIGLTGRFLSVMIGA